MGQILVHRSKDETRNSLIRVDLGSRSPVQEVARSVAFP